MPELARQYWEKIASTLRVARPLAPGPEDIEWFRRSAAAAFAAGENRAGIALVLGVTPSLLTFQWPRGVTPLALDWAVPIFRHRWPAGTASLGAAADWRRLPLESGATRFACGDGCYTALGRATDIPEVNREVARTLVRGGTLALRCFVRPPDGLSAQALCALLRGGGLPNPSLFRWLFAMALHGDAADGVEVGAVWEAWNRAFPDRDELRRLGWDDEAFRGFDQWKGQRMRYCFHTTQELRRLAEPHLEMEAIDLPGYSFGERFPRITLRKP